MWYKGAYPTVLYFLSYILVTSSYFTIVTHMRSSGISQIDHAPAEDMRPKYPPWIRFYPSAAPRVKPNTRRIYRRISSAVTWSILYINPDLDRCHSKFDRSEIRSRRQNLLGNTIAERFNLLGNTVAPRKYYRTLALHLPSTQRTWHSHVDFDLCSNVPRPKSGLTPAFLAGWERLM